MVYCKQHEPKNLNEKDPIPFSTYFDKNWHALEFRPLWAFHLRKELQTLGTTSSNALESFNGKIKHRLNTHIHLAKAIEELMLFTEEKFVDFTRRDCFTLKISTNSWKLGSRFLTLHDFLCQNAINHIVEQQKLTDQNEYKHVEIASSSLSFFVFKGENSTKHTVRCDSNDKYQCDCEFSKVYSLPCRHVLHIVATQDLCIFASYSYLPRWLKERPFDIDESSSDSIYLLFML